MPGPYTAFTFGDGTGNDPVVSQATFLKGPYVLGFQLGPAPVGAALAGGILGVAYSETISSYGGTAPLTFSLASGSLPTSTSMSSGGVITGTPSATGTFNFTVKVTDAYGFTGIQAFSITVSSKASYAVVQ